MAGVLLDSTVLIDILRGRPDAWQRYDALERTGDVPYICAVNVEEIARGLRELERTEAERLVSSFPVVPLGAKEGWVAGAWRQTFAAVGVTLGQGDSLIAAAAFALGGRLATGNPTHFPMTELQVEHWPAGA